MSPRNNRGQQRPGASTPRGNRASGANARPGAHRASGSFSSRNQTAYGQQDYAQYSRNGYSSNANADSNGASGAGGPQSQRAAAGAFRSAYIPDSSYRGNGAASQYSRSGSQYQARKKGKDRKKIAVIVAVVVLVLAVAGVAAAIVINNYINDVNKQLQGDKTSEELAAIDQQLTATATYSEPFYMMLVGSDARAGDEEMGQRSDTNIVARVDAANKQITLVSIPRDTMIDLDGVGTSKFNAAYNYGGVASVIREAKSLTGVSIAHYAEIDFDGLQDLVDAVGGVEVEVTERIDDTDADNTTDNPDGERIIIEEGVQTLNGEQALVFARSRAYVDGDFTRVNNQRKLIQAIANKVMNMSATEIPSVISAASKCVTTDMSVQDLVNLALQMRGNDKEMVLYSATVPSTTQYVDGISYVVNDTAGTKELMQVVDQGGDPSTVTNGYLGDTSSSTTSSTSTSTSTYSGGGYAGSNYTDGTSTYGGGYAGSNYTDGTSTAGGGYAGSNYTDGTSTTGGGYAGSNYTTG